MTLAKEPDSSDPPVDAVPDQGAQASAQTSSEEDLSVNAPELQEFTPSEGDQEETPLERLRHVSFEVTAVLGNAHCTVEEILKLGTGAVVELDQAVSDPVELIVQDKKLAGGEIVVVNDRFAIRITEIAEQ